MIFDTSQLHHQTPFSKTRRIYESENGTIVSLPTFLLTFSCKMAKVHKMRNLGNRRNFSYIIVHFSLAFGSFHTKWTKARHDPSQIMMKLFQMKGIYEIRLSWKFQHKLITHSKVITPQSWHSKLKIGKTRGAQAVWVHFWVSITFFVLNPNFLNVLHCFCAQRTLR